MMLGARKANMRWLAATCLALATISTASAENLIGKAAVLRTLDKVTATTKDYTVNIGDKLDYGTLRIEVRHCEKRPPEEIPESFAFIQIYDHQTDLRDEFVAAHDEDIVKVTAPDKDAEDGKEIKPAKVFSGWMLASNPAISALDHPVYDVWVIDCRTDAAKL